MWMEALILWACRMRMEPNHINELLLKMDDQKEFSIGNDIVFLPDFKASYNELFQRKVYTVSEIEYCESFSEPILRYASTWAAKEAVYKALKQVDKTLLGWKDIEISREKASGQPLVKLHKNSIKLTISLTLTHDGEYVWALAMIKRPSH